MISNYDCYLVNLAVFINLFKITALCPCEFYFVTSRLGTTHLDGYVSIKVIVNIYCWWSARGVMVIVVGNGHGDMSSNPGQDWLHFT